MYASHASLREDNEVSCPELDMVVEMCRNLSAQEPIIGCRMTGAGFGGCAVSLVQTEAVKRVTRKLEEGYEHRTGKHLAIFSSRPAAGSRGRGGSCRSRVGVGSGAAVLGGEGVSVWGILTSVPGHRWSPTPSGSG